MGPAFTRAVKGFFTNHKLKTTAAVSAVAGINVGAYLFGEVPPAGFGTFTVSTC